MMGFGAIALFLALRSLLGGHRGHSNAVSLQEIANQLKIKAIAHIFTEKRSLPYRKPDRKQRPLPRPSRETPQASAANSR